MGQGTQEAAICYKILEKGDVLKQENVGSRCRDWRLMLTFWDSERHSEVVHAYTCVWVCACLWVWIFVHTWCLHVHMCGCISMCVCVNPLCVLVFCHLVHSFLLLLCYLSINLSISIYLSIYQFLLNSHTLLKTFYRRHPVQCISVAILWVYFYNHRLPWGTKI